MKHLVKIFVKNADCYENYSQSPSLNLESRTYVKTLYLLKGKLTDELAGEYYPLLGMEEATRQKLVDDHFLFMSGDKVGDPFFLSEACSMTFCF